MTRAFILASGDQSRWSAPYPKQLAKVCGEPVINRTCRQLKAHGIIPAVITHDPEIAKAVNASVMVLQEQNRRWIAESILSTADLWEGFNIFLHGDVCFTDAAIDRIVQPRNGRAIVGDWYELFGLVIHEDATDRIKHELEYVISRAEDDPTPPAGKLWQIFWSMTYECGDAAVYQEDRARFKTFGIPEGERDMWRWIDSIRYGYFMLIEDYTDDFDTVEKYRRVRSQFEGIEAEAKPGRFSIWGK